MLSIYKQLFAFDVKLLIEVLHKVQNIHKNEDKEQLNFGNEIKDGFRLKFVCLYAKESI